MSYFEPKVRYSVRDLCREEIASLFTKCLENSNTKNIFYCTLFKKENGFKEDSRPIAFDADALNSFRNTIESVFGQLEDIHQKRKITSPQTINKKYDGTIWLTSRQGLIELLHLGTAIGILGPLMPDNTMSIIKEIHPTVSPRDRRPLIAEAEQGDADAQYRLASILADVDKTEDSIKEALKWYKSAAEQGHAKAQFWLGEMYLTGKGVERNYKEACKWVKLAAEQGYKTAQHYLTKMNMKEETFVRHKSAAERGDAEAQFNLAKMYIQGDGTECNYEEALKWFKSAAAQGHAEAQYILRQVQEI